MEFHRSAFKHGFTKTAVRHAINNAVVELELEPEADPPRVLAIGPDPDGRWLEVIWLQLRDQDLVIHAMKLRPTFHELLPERGEP